MLVALTTESEQNVNILSQPLAQLACFERGLRSLLVPQWHYKTKASHTLPVSCCRAVVDRESEKEYHGDAGRSQMRMSFPSLPSALLLSAGIPAAQPVRDRCRLIVASCSPLAVAFDSSDREETARETRRAVSTPLAP